jgi:hypothetical protein
MFAAYDEYENLELVAGSLQFGTLRILNPEIASHHHGRQAGARREHIRHCKFQLSSYYKATCLSAGGDWNGIVPRQNNSLNNFIFSICR